MSRCCFRRPEAEYHLFCELSVKESYPSSPLQALSHSRLRKRIERWLRGREEHQRLMQCDWVLMSWGKSGRTWLRVMLSRSYQLLSGAEKNTLLDFDNFRKLSPQLPAVFFSHNNYLRDYTGNYDNMDHFAGKPIVLLVRDPRDVAVSQFFQWLYRMRPGKKFINDYPPHEVNVSLWDFICDEAAGVPRIVEFFNGWAREAEARDDILVVRYEDLRAEPAVTLGQILNFTGTTVTPEQIEEAVAFGAYDNMKRMEEGNFFKASGARVKPGDRNNQNSYKVRKAKVGGYLDYVTEEQAQHLNEMMKQLHSMFGYEVASA